MAFGRALRRRLEGVEPLGVAPGAEEVRDLVLEKAERPREAARGVAEGVPGVPARLFEEAGSGGERADLGRAVGEGVDAREEPDPGRLRVFGASLLEEPGGPGGLLRDARLLRREELSLPGEEQAFQRGRAVGAGPAGVGEGARDGADRGEEGRARRPGRHLQGLLPERLAYGGRSLPFGGARLLAAGGALGSAHRVARQVHPVVPLVRRGRVEVDEREVRGEHGFVAGAARDEPGDPGEEEIANRGAAHEPPEPLAGAPAAVPVFGERRDVLGDRAVAIAQLFLQDSRLEGVETRLPEARPPFRQDVEGLAEAAVVPEGGRRLQDCSGVAGRGSEDLPERLSCRGGPFEVLPHFADRRPEGRRVGGGRRGAGGNPLGGGGALGGERRERAFEGDRVVGPDGVAGVGLREGLGERYGPLEARQADPAIEEEEALDGGLRRRFLEPPQERLERPLLHEGVEKAAAPRRIGPEDGVTAEGEERVVDDRTILHVPRPLRLHRVEGRTGQEAGLGPFENGRARRETLERAEREEV